MPLSAFSALQSNSESDWLSGLSAGRKRYIRPLHCLRPQHGNGQDSPFLLCLQVPVPLDDSGDKARRRVVSFELRHWHDSI